MTINQSLKWVLAVSIASCIIGAGLLVIYTNASNGGNILLYLSVFFILLYTITATYYLLIKKLIKRNIIDSNSKNLFNDR